VPTLLAFVAQEVGLRPGVAFACESDSDSVGESADSSDNSANSSADSSDSSDCGQATADSSADSSADAANATVSTLVGTAVFLAVAAVVAVVVVVVVVSSRRHHRPRLRLDTPEDPKPTEAFGAGLVAQGLVTYGSALDGVLAELVKSPSAMDALTADVEAGGGPALDALARAAGLPGAEVAEAWRDATRSGPAASAPEAFAVVVRFVEDVGPGLGPDAGAAEELLWQLAREQDRPDFPAVAPAHARLARWTGLSVAQVTPVVASVLADADGTDADGADAGGAAAGGEGACADTAGAATGSRRARLSVDALERVDELGAALGAAWPDAVTARVQSLYAEGARLGVHTDLAETAAL
jgi:hypothetical protein